MFDNNSYDATTFCATAECCASATNDAQRQACGEDGGSIMLPPTQSPTLATPIVNLYMVRAFDKTNGEILDLVKNGSYCLTIIVFNENNFNRHAQKRAPIHRYVSA